jgi:hypothetical protein
VLSYVDQYGEQYIEVGAESFRRLHPWAFLVALGMVGDLSENRSSGTTITKISNGILERGRITGRVFPLTKSRYAPRGPITIGRTSENDIVIPEYSVSRKHCFLGLAEGNYRITDCGSANGTLVDGTPIGKLIPHPLRGGEILTLGRLMLLFLPPREFQEYIRNLAPPQDFSGGTS